MVQDNSSNVINFEKKGRRKAIARLTKNYSTVLVQTMGRSMLDDGEHFSEAGHPLCRALDLSECAHGAVITAAQFFTALLLVRFRHEDPMTDGGTLEFCENARKRMIHYSRDWMGRSRILLPPREKRDLANIEKAYVSAILDALKIEATNDPNWSEAEFWTDVFRGFGDADPSGVVAKAAGVVLLNHLTHFHLALTADMAASA
jgi:hypothetical protein